MADDLRKALARTVSRWMDARGITVLSLHKSTGLGRQTIYRLTKGTGDSSIDTLARVARELGTTPAALLEGQDPPPRTAIRPVAGSGKTAQALAFSALPAFSHEHRDADIDDLVDAVTWLEAAVRNLAAALESSGAKVELPPAPQRSDQATTQKRADA